MRKKSEDLKLRKDRLREVEKELSALHEKFDMGKLQIESVRYFIRGTFQKIHSQEETGLPNVPAVFGKLIDSL